jgi:hypothetical protein
MTLSMFVKGKIDFRYVQIWHWVCLLKEKLNMTLSMFVKGKVDFKCVQIWLWVCLSKGKLTLDMSEYDFKYVFQKKSWL